MTTLVGVRRALGSGASGFNPLVPDFSIALADLGAGVVDTSTSFGVGPATFTRATTGTTVLSTRLIGNVGSGNPRSVYSPSGTYLGYLSEPQSTNLVLQSENFGTTWVAIGTPTRVAASDTCGTVVLDTIGDDSAAALEGYSQAITFTGNAVKCVSIFVKAGTSTSTVIRVRDTTATADRLLVTLAWGGGVPTPTYTTGVACGVDALGNSVYRIRSMTSAVTAANTNQIEVYPATDAALSVANTGTVLAGGVQAEDQVNFCTSYIPTTVATVTRNADVLTYPGNSGVAVGTAYAEVNRPTAPAFTSGVAYVNVDSAGASGRTFALLAGQAATTISSFDGVTTNTKTGITDLSAGTPVKVACVWSGVTQKVGETSATLASAIFDGTMGDALAVQIGHANGGSQPCGGIKNVKVWKKAASDAQVLAL